MSAKSSTPCENSRAVHISPHNSGTVIDSEKVQLRRIESRPCASLQPAINQGNALPLISPEWDSVPKCVVFLQKFPPKQLKVCYKVLLSTNFQRQGYSAMNYLSNGINILARDDPVPVKFGPKGIDPQ